MPWIVCEVCKEEEYRSAKSPCSYCAGLIGKSEGDIPELTPDGELPPVPETKAKASNVVRAKITAPATLDDVVRAQNRTTHAIRAFVRFLFIQLSMTTLAYIVFSIASTLAESGSCRLSGNCGGPVVLYIISFAIWLIGVITSSIAGNNELNKSNVPN